VVCERTVTARGLRARRAVTSLPDRERALEVLDGLERAVPPPDTAALALQSLGSLTAKPVLYVANVDEEGAADAPAALAERAAGAGAGALAVSARIEAELAELDAEEASAMRAELGAAESGLARLVRAAFELLDLISFFTAGEGKEARAHAIERGTTAWGAAGKIHSDIQRGFVRAEVVNSEALVEAGGYAGARERAALRLEGRDYEMRDGDVITIRFTP